MLNSLCKILILTLLIASTPALAGKIIKWVDKHGVTHYGDKPPMPTKAKKSTLLNNQGVKLKEFDSRPLNTKVEEKQLEQSRYDKALLATYNSADEIDLAKERNTRIDILALEGLEQKHQALTNRIAENNKILLDHAKENKKAPTDTITQVGQDNHSLANLEKQIAARKNTIDEINQRYAKDKLRYTELQNRKGQLDHISHNKQSIAELKEWKIDAEKRHNHFQSESIKYTRWGKPKPKWVTDGLLQTTQELERVNQEIRTKELAIQKSKSQFSKK